MWSVPCYSCCMARKTSSTKKTPKQTKVTKTAAKAEPKANRNNTLQKWNLRIGALLIIEAIAILLLGGAQTVPITTHYLATDTLASEASGHQVLAVATRHIADVHLSWVVAKFLLIFGLLHILAGTVLRTRYDAWIAKGVNGLRWLALGAGGGVMTVAIAMLSGFTDIATLVLLFVSVFVAGSLGLVAELLGPDARIRRLLAGLAILGVALPWLVFATTALNVALFNGSLPTFVYYIYASMFLCFAGGLWAACLRMKKRGKWADATYTEKAFMVIGVVAASALAWQIFVGAL